ncbi:MAG: ArsR/SmtB family transcription factor [Minisyncoccia bacterium]
MKYYPLKKKTINPKDIKKLSEFLKIISEENRLKILFILQNQEKCVCEIWQILNLPQNLISHHLKVLKKFNLVSSRKVGLKIFYKLNLKVVKKYINLLNKFLKL